MCRGLVDKLHCCCLRKEPGIEQSKAAENVEESFSQESPQSRAFFFLMYEFMYAQGSLCASWLFYSIDGGAGGAQEHIEARDYVEALAPNK